MSETLTYAQLGERLGCSAEAARAIAKRNRLPRQRGNDGKALVVVDVAELMQIGVPTRSHNRQRRNVAALNARIEALQAEIVRLTATASGHRADDERERDRADSERHRADYERGRADGERERADHKQMCADQERERADQELEKADKLMSEALAHTIELMAAKEHAARLERE